MTVIITDLIPLPLSQQAIDWAVETTSKKYPSLNIRGMIRRSPFRALDNLFQGELAKNVIIEWLENNGVQNIEEYDKVRTDNFKDADPGWDFKVRDKKIEVKSSLPPKPIATGLKETNQEIIDNRDVKVIAEKHERETPTNKLTSDVFLQIYFRDDFLKGSTSFKEICNQLDQIKELLNLSQRLKEPIAFAWATRDDVQDFEKLHTQKGERTTWTFSGAYCTYWRCPIKDSQKISDLPNHLSRV